jgi:hypothetical protein
MADFPGDDLMPKVPAAIEDAEVLRLSERDFKRILELLEHPPLPNARLRAAIAALPNKVVTFWLDRERYPVAAGAASFLSAASRSSSRLFSISFAAQIETS